MTACRRVLKAFTVNINSAATDVATVDVDAGANYRVVGVTIKDPSTSLAVSIATLGVFSAAAAGGTAIVALATMTGLTGATTSQTSTLANPTTIFTAGTLFIRNGIAHGSAATVTVVIELEMM